MKISKKALACLGLVLTIGGCILLPKSSFWADEEKGVIKEYGYEQVGNSNPVIIYEFNEPFVYVPFTWSTKTADVVMYSSTSLNVRDEPRVEGDRIGSYSYTQEVKVVGEVENSPWVQVDYNGKEGYCNSKYLLDTKPVIATPEPVEPVAVGSSGEAVIEEQSNSYYPLQLVGNVSNSFAKACYGYWCSIPENVRNRYISDGWSLVVTSNNFAADYGYSYNGILALTVFGNPGITYISTREGGKTAIIHEIGHYIDYVSGFTSNSEEFTNIRAEEVGTFASVFKTHHNNYDTTVEYFAEAFWRCVTNGSSMQQNCPKTYDYVMNISNSL